MGMMGRLFGKWPEEQYQPRTETMSSLSQDTGPLTMIHDLNVIEKFKSLTYEIKSKKANKEKLNAVWQVISEYDILLNDKVCEINMIDNNFGNTKWELIMSVFDTDGDGDVDEYDTQKFLISDHGEELRFKQMIIHQWSQFASFDDISPAQAKKLLDRVGEFLQDGEVVDRDLNTENLIFANEYTDEYA